MKPADIPASTDKDDQAREEVATGRTAERAFSPQAWMSCLHYSESDSRLDTSVAHPARVYDYWLGGKDNYDADRKMAEDVMRLRPQVVAGARANRAFLARVVRFLAADCGIRQFLDIGAGLPASDNTHEIAQRSAPASKVVYCDNDALVLSHARALLTSTTPQGVCEYVEADLRAPQTIVAEAGKTLDFTQPAAILLLAVAHFLPDRDRPAEIVATLASALAPGSYVAISHLTADLAPEQVGAAVAAYNDLAALPVAARTHAQVSALFGALPLLEPGVVPVNQWRPGIGVIPQPCDLYAGVACIGQRYATGEPTLAEVQAQYPHWQCGQAISGMYFADRPATGQQVTGEDPLDLRDQIKAAEARHAWHTALL